MNNFTKILFVAFIISLCIHFMLFIAIDKTIQNDNLNINTTNKKNSTKKNGLVKVKYVKIKQPPKTKPKEKKSSKELKKITSFDPKNVQTKKSKPIVKKQNNSKKKIPLIKLPDTQKQQIDLKQLFTIPKEDLAKQQEEKIQKEREIQEEIQELQKLPEITQSYIKLYGEKYFEFSKEQRRYLKQNLSKIGEITQRYLTYPRISIRTKQQGVNVIEFYLHPNGDISEVRISDTSYYTALDQNTIETIKLAYQDYPRPQEKVKIKIYVKYILY